MNILVVDFLILIIEINCLSILCSLAIQFNENRNMKNKTIRYCIFNIKNQFIIFQGKIITEIIIILYIGNLKKSNWL